MKQRLIAVSVLLAVLAALLLFSGGCATSKSYAAGVADLHPVIAGRLANYVADDAGLPPKIDALVASAQRPVNYPTASKAWRDVSGDYREHVGADPTLFEFRRNEWLRTADVLDRMNAAEARRRLLFFLPP